MRPSDVSSPQLRSIPSTGEAPLAAPSKVSTPVPVSRWRRSARRPAPSTLMSWRDRPGCAPAFEAAGRSLRARLLRAVADQLESRREEIVEVGMRETALTGVRLNGALPGRLSGLGVRDVVEEGTV